MCTIISTVLLVVDLAWLIGSFHPVSRTISLMWTPNNQVFFKYAVHC